MNDDIDYVEIELSILPGFVVRVAKSEIPALAAKSLAMFLMHHTEDEALVMLEARIAGVVPGQKAPDAIDHEALRMLKDGSWRMYVESENETRH